jgi:hypothetical protein
MTHPVPGVRTRHLQAISARVSRKEDRQRGVIRLPEAT